MTSPIQEFRNLLRSRVSLFWVQTQEEVRVERALAEVQLARPVSTNGPGAYRVRFWDCASGLTDAVSGEPVPCETGVPDPMGGPPIMMDRSREPLGVFDAIRRGESIPVDDPAPEEPEERGVSVLWVLRDLDAWLKEPQVLRGLRTLAHDLEQEQDLARVSAVVVLTASGEIPDCLRDEVTVIRWPLPTRDELREVLSLTLNTNHAMVDGEQEDAVDAAAGLTLRDAHNAYCYSIVSSKPARVVPSIVSDRKKAIVEKDGLLTWFDPDPRGLDALGGLDLVKLEILELAEALSLEAQAFGLKTPQGLLFCGPPGTGKSLLCKAAPSAFDLPLLRLDFGALKGMYQGQSESNIRKALAMAEAIAPCVLWCDEIDTGLAGATSDWTGDNGTSKDQLGTLLTWRQECKKFVFLLATTNNPQRLPAPLTRAGRFNATFFVDLPGTADRESILAVCLRGLGGKDKRNPQDFDLAAVAGATQGFSGAELDAAVNAALRAAWRDRVKMETRHLLTAVRVMVPNSKSNAEEYHRLRQWAAQRARPASSAAPEPQPSTTPTQPTRPVGRLLGVESEE